KVNFNKAILICNRDPHDVQCNLPDIPTPYLFDVGPASFNISPLPPKDSFRFLGVWFTISLRSSFILKQCKSEYTLFSNKLRFKRLTANQITYLHNTVLAPKVC